LGYNKKTKIEGAGHHDYCVIYQGKFTALQRLAEDVKSRGYRGVSEWQIIPPKHEKI
jgi:hypothetical protein